MASSSKASRAPLNRFKGHGFHKWQTRIKLMLMKKALWGITNGKERKPRDATDAATWEGRDNKAQDIIKLELDDTYIHHVDGCETAKENWDQLDTLFHTHHVDGCETAKETWDQLDTLFGAQAKSSKFGLLIEFFKLKMSSKTPLASHLNNMQSLMTQLAGISLKVDEDIAIAVLLKSLPSSYDHIVTTLTNMPISKLVDVQASLLEEEKKMNGKARSSKQVLSAFGRLMFDLLLSRPDLAIAVGSFAAGIASSMRTDASMMLSGALQTLQGCLRDLHIGFSVDLQARLEPMLLYVD
ncbi:hypothetical protein L7F22_006832 [Adiantum nelumboides]|nr:hypothetical protein [Adiantum nelumboides]